MILGFTNCSIDLVDDVCVVVVVVFNVVVVVVVVVEGVSKFFSFLEMNDFELVFLETYPSFPSNNPKMHPKCCSGLVAPSGTRGLGNPAAVKRF